MGIFSPELDIPIYNPGLKGLQTKIKDGFSLVGIGLTKENNVGIV